MRNRTLIFVIFVIFVLCRTSATISASPPSNPYGKSPTSCSSIRSTRSSRVGGDPMMHLCLTSSSTESFKSFSAWMIWGSEQLSHKWSGGNLIINQSNWVIEESFASASCAFTMLPSVFMTASRASCQSHTIYWVPRWFLNYSSAAGKVMHAACCKVSDYFPCTMIWMWAWEDVISSFNTSLQDNEQFYTQWWSDPTQTLGSLCVSNNSEWLMHWSASRLCVLTTFLLVNISYRSYRSCAPLPHPSQSHEGRILSDNELWSTVMSLRQGVTHKLRTWDRMCCSH